MRPGVDDNVDPRGQPPPGNACGNPESLCLTDYLSIKPITQRITVSYKAHAGKVARFNFILGVPSSSSKYRQME